MVFINDAFRHKVASIEHAVKRIEGVYHTSSHFENDLTSQESVIFNLQRACQACTDIANITCKQYKIGVPRSGRDSFERMKKADLLNESLASNLQAIDDLRSIAVHDVQTLNLDIVKHVVEKKLGNFTDFIFEIRKLP